MSFDLAKSLAPDKPIFDSEWHAVDTVFFRDRRIPAEHMHAALWLGRLHGLSATLIWWWSRHRGPEHKGRWFDASLLEQPWLLEAYAQTSLQQRRFVREILAFSQAPRPVRLLYSEASAIQDVEYLDELLNAYEALNFLGVSVGYLTENQLRAGLPAEVRLLIVPHARFVEDGTVRTLAGLARSPGSVKVTVIGSRSLARTPTGYPREPAPEILAETVARTQPREAHGTLARWTDEAGIRPLLVAVDPDGQPAWGVEVRSVESDGRRLAYLVNLMLEETRVRLDWNAPDPAPRNLLTGAPVDTVLELRPLEVALIEF
jgi:beta-galactosidase